MKKGFAIAVRVIVLILLSPVIIPLLIGVLVYELSPGRRKQLFDYETTILHLLARRGEIRGYELRELANEELGSRIGFGTFYSIMSRLEDQGLVESREEAAPDEGHPELGMRKQLYYRLTKGGRGERTRRAMTVGEAVQALPGRLRPGLA